MSSFLYPGSRLIDVTRFHKAIFARSEASVIDSDDGVVELLPITGFPENKSYEDEGRDNDELEDYDSEDDRFTVIDEVPVSSKERILKWQRSMGYLTAVPISPQSNRSSSPTPSQSSTSTIRDCSDDFDLRGFWLAGNPSEQRADYE